MEKKIGLRISERMAGHISFSKDYCEKVKANVFYPFAFKINAFTLKPLNYPCALVFEGVCDLVGFPLLSKQKLEERRPFVSGSMKISLAGVAYDFICQLPGIGKVRIVGKKSYAWKQGGPFNWPTFRDSLITLPLSVYLLSEIEGEKEQQIGQGEMRYLNPLWQFAFGLRLCQAQYAYRPRGKLAQKLVKVGCAFVPSSSRKFDLKVVAQGIEEQLNCSPYVVYQTIKLNYILLNIISFLLFFNSFLTLSLGKQEKLLRFIRRKSFLKFCLLPLFVSVLNSMFSDRKFLKEKGQNIVVPPLEQEPEVGASLHITPSFGPGREKNIEVDVLVIGSGAGGASLAYQLARKGHAVAIVEEGAYFKRPDLTGMTGEMIRKLYRSHGINFSYSNAALWIPTGKCVGGTTMINSGTCIRTPDSILKKWKSNLGLDLDLNKYFPAVEEMLNVGLVPEAIQGGIRKVLEKGLDDHGPYQLGALNRAERGCDGQSFCAVGCPTGAKQSTAVSFIPAALKHHAHLFSEYHVDKLLMKNGRVTGAHAQVSGFGPEFDLVFHAKKTVVAAGAFGSPQLLYQSGMHHHLRQLGQNLSIHPACTVGGLFNEKVRESLFVPQSLGVFGIGAGDYALEGYTLPVDTIAAALTQFGSELEEIFENINYFANFSSMISDTSLGKIIFTKQGPIPEYMMDGRLCQLAKESSLLLAEIFFKANAKKVYLPFNGSDVVNNMSELSLLKKKKISASQIVFSAHHPLGTCRMGNHPDQSVVDQQGKVWGLKDLFISDGSVIPGPLGVNPQVTIMANSLRIADFIDGQLKEGV